MHRQTAGRHVVHLSWHGRARQSSCRTASVAGTSSAGQTMDVVLWLSVMFWQAIEVACLGKLSERCLHMLAGQHAICHRSAFAFSGKNNMLCVCCIDLMSRMILLSAHFTEEAQFRWRWADCSEEHVCMCWRLLMFVAVV